MRVLIIASHYAPEPTGNAPYTTGLATGLASRGFDVHVLTTHPHYPQWELPRGAAWRSDDLVEQLPVRRLRHYVPSSPRGPRRLLAELSFGMQGVTSRWHSPDVVLCPSPALFATAAVLGRARLGLRHPATGVIVQDLYSAGVAEVGGYSGPVARAVASAERRILRAADGVAVIHDRFRDRLLGTMGLERSRIDVIRNWTHVASPSSVDVESARSEMGWRADEAIVLHAGAIGEKQDLMNVVNAARICERSGKRIRFVLLGDGGQRQSLESAARDCRSVEFVDPLPEERFISVMAAADVLLVNERPGSIEMAVPSKLTSYFSSGRPVLAATDDLSITASEVRASGAGVVVLPGVPASLVDGVLELMREPARATEMGLRGPDYCRRYLSEESALDRYSAWVHKLAMRKQRRS